MNVGELFVAPRPDGRSEGCKVRGQYQYDAEWVSHLTGLECDPDEKMTQESFKDECDINTIVRNFGLTGELPETARPPQVGDFTGVSDFQSAQEAVAKAWEGFMAFPAEVRSRFENDPQRMMEFLADVKNRDEAVLLGLVRKAPEVPRSAVQAIDELAAKLAVPKAGA